MAALCLVAAFFLSACGGGESTTTAGATAPDASADYDLTTAEHFDLPFAEQRKVIDSLLAQEETECEGELPETFYADVAARAFAAPRRTPLTEVVLQLCAEGYGTFAG